MIFIFHIVYENNEPMAPVILIGILSCIDGRAMMLVILCIALIVLKLTVQENKLWRFSNHPVTCWKRARVAVTEEERKKKKKKKKKSKKLPTPYVNRFSDPKNLMLVC